MRLRDKAWPPPFALGDRETVFTSYGSCGDPRPCPLCGDERALGGVRELRWRWAEGPGGGMHAMTEETIDHPMCLGCVMGFFHGEAFGDMWREQRRW